MLHAHSSSASLASAHPFRQRLIPARATISSKGASPFTGGYRRKSAQSSTGMREFAANPNSGTFPLQQSHWHARPGIAPPQVAEAMNILKCAPPAIRRQISELLTTCEHSNHEQVERLTSAERELANLRSEYARLHRDRKREVAELLAEISGLRDMARLAFHMRADGASSSLSTAGALRAAADNLDLRAEMARLRLELDAVRVENFKLLSEIELVRGGGGYGREQQEPDTRMMRAPFGGPFSSSSSSSLPSPPPSALFEQPSEEDLNRFEERGDELEEEEEGLLMMRQPRATGGARRHMFQTMEASDLGFFETLPPPPPPPPPPVSSTTTSPTAPSPSVATTSEYPVPPPSYAQFLSNQRAAAPILAPASAFELPPSSSSSLSQPPTIPSAAPKAVAAEEEKEGNELATKEPAPSSSLNKRKKKAGMPRQQWVPLSYHKCPPKYPCVGPRRKKKKGTSSSSLSKGCSANSTSASSTTTTTTMTTTNTITEHHHHYHHYIPSTASSPDPFHLHSGRASPAGALSLSPSPCGFPPLPSF